ncbi:acyl-CoA synthetases/AMP-acid ligases II [Sporormia fimetaria CBS 119925]|uniref:Acyl-CoA synthetases/AMP-acid ligases II n=1 Tax=Sporormia fimetaria CBS 119925 TaxID=1340428 RepID=A0A6A6UZW2_9PLEO|nr:acyl-CoA synthetases/AMP-acid ligases II [Sporormia fimetaria CBS 119925]
MAANIYKSSYPRVVVPTNESIWQFLVASNIDDVSPRKVVLQEYERPERTLTYGGASQVAARGGSGLQRVLGLRSEDTIMLMGTNTLDWVELAISAIWAGITFAGVNCLASPQELIHYITATEPKAIFVEPAFMSNVSKALELLPKALFKPTVVGIDFTSSQATALPFDLSRRDNRKVVAAIVFSSGTSGKPKAVMLSHHNLINAVVSLRSSAPEMYNQNQTEVFYAPLCHIYGLITALLAPLFSGCFVVLMRKYDLKGYIQACSQLRATLLKVVPPTAVALAKDPWLATQDLTSVNTIMCAGAVLAPEIIARLEELMKGVCITQAYGMSECVITTLKPEASKRKPGSVGKILANSDIRIVDDDLRDVSPGESGEIIVRGPSLFIGYKNNPEATAEAFLDGKEWMKTGDVGRIDEEGFLYLTDRKKDLIKYRGHQVPPAELEDVLLSHDLVTEAGVCAKWDDDQGTEIPVGYVSLSPKVPAQDRERVIAEVKESHDKHVASYKKLRGGLFYLPTLPRTPTGKLLRRELPARKQAVNAATRKTQSKL